MVGSSEFMGKTFQAAQLTHERFLTIDTPPIAEILCVKNGRVIVVCGFLMK